MTRLEDFATLETTRFADRVTLDAAHLFDLATLEAMRVAKIDEDRPSCSVRSRSYKFGMRSVFANLVSVKPHIKITPGIPAPCAPVVLL